MRISASLCKTDPDKVQITVRLRHEKPHIDEGGKHVPYFNVGLPAGAADIVQENVGKSLPQELTPMIQNLFPNVTAKQVQRAWSTMSEVLWRRTADPMSSATELLREYEENGEAKLLLLDGEVPDGVEIKAFAFPRVIDRLQTENQHIHEVGMDATCKCLPKYAYTYLIYFRWNK